MLQWSTCCEESFMVGLEGLWFYIADSQPKFVVTLTLLFASYIAVGFNLWFQTHA